MKTTDHGPTTVPGQASTADRARRGRSSLSLHPDRAGAAGSVLEGVDAASEQRGQLCLLVVVEIAEHPRVHEFDIGMAGVEEFPATRGQPSLEDPAVVGVGAAFDEAISFEASRDLIHGLGCDEAPAGKGRIGQTVECESLASSGGGALAYMNRLVSEGRN